MKRYVKIGIISLGALLTLSIAAVCIVIWLVFTPQKLTPLIQKQLPNFVTCQTEIESVELTFFSTFPQFGLKLNKLALINPTAGAPSDTLLSLDQLVATIDANAFRKHKHIILNELTLSKGQANVFIDSLGNTNFDVFASDPDTLAAPSEPSEMTIELIQIEGIHFENVRFSYIDLAAKMNAAIDGLNARFNGTLQADVLKSKLTLEPSTVSFTFDGENYLDSFPISLEMNSEINLKTQEILIEKALASISGIPLELDGTVANRLAPEAIETRLNLKIPSARIEEALKLVPPSFQSYFEGLELTGDFSTTGTINGFFDATRMPLFDLSFEIADGKMGYEGVPLKLSQAAGQARFTTDGINDSVTQLQIEWFEAQTPQSSFRTSGSVKNLFTDLLCDLQTTARITLSEMEPFIPAELKTKMKGTVSGTVYTRFTLSQLDKMEIEKMKLKGETQWANVQIDYDTLHAAFNQTQIDFALPHPAPQSNETRFLSAFIDADELQASSLDHMNANLRRAKLNIETSDIRDTTRIPNLICSFEAENLKGQMDTMALEVDAPVATIRMKPRANNAMEPHIELTVESNEMNATVGKNQAQLAHLKLVTEVENHSEQTDPILKWMANGMIELTEGHVLADGFSHPIELPKFELKFTPETFALNKSGMRIGNSDFRLTGTIDNFWPYYKGDSILRGSLLFESSNTDLQQLMQLTSGLGEDKDSVQTETTAQTTDSTYTGPYMVPKGVDVALRTNIQQATFGLDTAKYIKGEVRVKDGILVLDGVSLTTPAARMQLTALYRTPRKNHLFLGIDYHMLDIEISELLRMIPDIDTLMPMLRSFSGKGEFHITVETYLDSLYNMKKSTLRGSSSIKGQDLVLMDGETFSEIAKTLRFNKKTQNRVDSLSAEFTIFRNNIDIFPFLIVMDKYKAVVGGRHNFDMSFDYHISVVDSPLPFKLGVDIKGNMDDMKYRPAACKYPEFYRPTARKAVENKQLELRKMIRETLTQKVQN